MSKRLRGIRGTEAVKAFVAAGGVKRKGKGDHINIKMQNGQIITSLDYSQVELAADARRQPMKLWSSTANGLQRSRCGKIGLPLGKKCRLI